MDDQVEKEMERLCQNAILQLCYVPFESVDSTLHFKLAFNNCRSLHLHIKDIRHDQTFLSSHVFGLAESRLHQSDINHDYKIDGFTLIRNDQMTNCRAKRPPHGLAVYVNENSRIISEVSFSSSSLEFTVVNIANTFGEKQVVVLYKAPNMSTNEFITVLESKLIPYLNISKPLVIMGDFNLDVFGKHKKLIQILGQKLSCKMMINVPTTDNLSTLDLIFSNVNGTAGTVETYWSDHKIVFYHT